MDSFKIRKQMLLNWFLGGNHIEICSQPGHSFGKLYSSTPLPVDKHREVINRLIRDGSIKSQEFYYHGIRWDRLIPTEGGCHENN